MIEQSLYCVLGKQKKWLLCHKQGRTCILALCVTLSFTRVTPMWSHTCFLLVIHLNNHLIFKVKEARKETDFLGYRGMKTSSSTQLLSRPITASMNVCVGHKYTLSTQTYCLLYIYMYFMQMFFFHVWNISAWQSSLWSVCATAHRQHLTNIGVHSSILPSWMSFFISCLIC